MLKRLAAAAALLWAAEAQAEPVKTGHAESQLISERAAITPGDQFLGALRIDIEEGGWHVYWKNPGDSGLAPEIHWETPDGVTVGDFQWPAPYAEQLATLMNYGYEHDVTLPFQVTAPANLKPGDTLTLRGHASWLICLDTCVPEDAELSISLPVEAAPRPDSTGGDFIAKSLAAMPRPLSGSATVERTANGFKLAAVDPDLALAAKSAASARFFPEGAEIEHFPPQPATRGDAGVALDLVASDLAPKGDAPLNGVLVLEPGQDGERKAWEISAQPGAIPVGVSGAKLGGAAGFGFATLLTTLALAFVGGLVLNLMPCVLPVLSIKAAGLVQTAHNPAEARAHGLFYTGGVLICFAVIGAIILGLRMAGEQAGLGFQLQYPPIVAFFALAMFALGLNLLGVFEIGGSLMGVGSNLADKGGNTGAFFTGLLAAFVGAPCVGPFMGPAVGVALSQPAPIVIGTFLAIGLGLAAPLLLLSFSPALARLLPRPGKWMATFRQLLAFPMFLTAIWLLWVLAGQAGSNGVVLVVLGATVLGFGIWLATKIGSGLGGKLVAGVVILAALFGPSVASASLKPPEAAPSGEHAAMTPEPWSPERVAAIQAEGRPVFVDFTARWCATCQVNKGYAIHSAEVAKTFAEHKVAYLEADWTNRDAVIAEELAKHGRAGVPLYLVYPAGGGEPQVLPQLLSPGVIVKAVGRAIGA